MSALTQNQTESFDRDGYLKFGRVIDDATVESLRAALDRVIEMERHGGVPGAPPEFAFGHDRGDGRADRAIHQFVNMWKVDPEYRAITHNPLITQAIRELMGAEQIRLWHDQIISKPPGENKLFSCHHDFYFWPLDRPTMITCWLALDDATVDNGCMHVVPGSHRDPRYQVGGELYTDIRTWGPERMKSVELKAGECMFHHCLNYHLTPQNITDRQRRAFVMIYMPDGTRYNHAQSPAHPCTSHLRLEEGSVIGGPNFPICG
jgi:ectoine hydroxylase-related dioxygenase (phytanoyl-CoA dioxygenase family)